MKTNYRRLIYSFIAATILFVIVPIVSFAEEQKREEDKVTGEIALSAFSTYISRGQELSRNSIVIQPSIALCYKGFSVNYWGNLDTKAYSAGNDNYASQYTETDLSLSYTKKFGVLQVTPGYIYYAYSSPNSIAPAPLDSQELFVTLALDTILSPTFTIYREIDHYHQWYLLLNVSHTFQLSKIISFKLSAQASYLKSEDAEAFARYDSNALPTMDKYNNFHEGTISLCLPVAAYKTLTISPTVSYTFPLCDDARYEMKGRGLKGVAHPADRDSSFLYGGVTFSFTF
jgi:hypothetical protein